MTANIDYVGKIDGTAFDGGSATGTDLTIGSNKFIDGFEDQLIGHKKGETVTVNVTFPSNYDKTELAGKAAEFTVTINKVKADPWSYIAEDSTVLKYPKDIVDLWTTQVAAAYSYYASTYSMTLSYSEPLAVTRMTGMTLVFGSLFKSARTERPSSPGSMISRRISSG